MVIDEISNAIICFKDSNGEMTFNRKLLDGGLISLMESYREGMKEQSIKKVAEKKY